MTNVVRHVQIRTEIGDNSPSKYVTGLSDNSLKNKFGEIRLKYRKQGATNEQKLWKVITFRYFFLNIKFGGTEDLVSSELGNRGRRVWAMWAC